MLRSGAFKIRTSREAVDEDRATARENSNWRASSLAEPQSTNGAGATAADFGTSPNDDSYQYVTGVPGTGGDFGSLLSGFKWSGVDSGSGKTIVTYSFSNANSVYPLDPQGMRPTLGAFSEADKQMTRAVLAKVEAVCNVDFVEVADNATECGVVRYAYSATLPGEYVGYAYYPDPSPIGGDVWLNESLGASKWDFYRPNLILHETLHAIGLDHPFEGAGPVLSAAQDIIPNTVMSYTHIAGATGGGYLQKYPGEPMLLDIAALQYLYGAAATNTGNTDYDLASASFQGFHAVWDAGGIDTFDARNLGKAVTLDLTAGALSNIGYSVHASAYTDSTRTQSVSTDYTHTLSIAPGAVIENAVGSNFGDTLQGNSVGNSLWGIGGNDIMYGAAGADTLGGGAGNDVVNGGDGGDTLSGVDGRDVMYGGNGIDKLQVGVAAANADVLKLRTNSVFFKDDAGNMAIVRDVEHIQYTASTVELSLLPTFDGVNLSLVEIYIAAFRRAPELSGYEYWSARVALEGINAVADVIFSLPIVQATYPQNMSSQAFVSAIYTNVFNKVADATGLAYWTSRLDASGSRGKLVLDISAAALGTADGTPGKDYFQNRVDWGLYAVAYQDLTNNEWTPAALTTLTGTVNQDGMTLVELIGQTVNQIPL